MPSPAPPARHPIPPAVADDDRPADTPTRPPRTPNASPLRREPAAPSPSAAPTAPAGASASAAAPPEAPPAPAEAEAAAPTPPRPVCTRVRNIRIPEGGEVSWMELRKIVPDGAEGCRERGKEGGREEGGEVGEGGGGARRRVESRNQFQQMLQDIQRKYATERTVEARLQKKRPRAAACGEEAEGEEAAGGEERARGEGGEEAEGEETEGEDEGSASRGSWYDVNDGFIDDSELLDEMGADDDGDSDSSGEAVLKSDGFFISRGALHSEAQLREQTERSAAPPPPPAKRQRSEGAAGRSSMRWDALCAIARMVGEEGAGGGGGGAEESAEAFERLLAQCTDAGKRRKINLKQVARVWFVRQGGWGAAEVVTIRRLVAALSRRASAEEMARLLPLPGADAPSAPPPPPANSSAAAAPPPLLPAADAAPAAAPPPAASSTPPRPPPAAAGEALPSPSAGGGEAAGGEAEGGGAVGAEEAAEVLAKAGEQIEAALEALRTKVGDDPNSDASSKKLRLPPELASVLSLLARWAQLRVYAQHAAAKTVAPTSADGTLLPSSWLDKQLLACVSAVLPLPKDSLRNRLRGLGEKTALPEQVEELRRRLGARLRAFHEAVQPVLLPLRAEYDDLRAAKRTAAKQRAAELLAALPSQPEALVGEKIEVRGEGKWRVVKVVRHVGPGAHFEVQDGASAAPPTHALAPAHSTDMHGANSESLLLEDNKWRRRDEPPPQPKFHWTAGLDAMLLQMGEMQLTIGKKKQEYLKLELPRELAGRHASIYTAASDEKTPHPPELDELFAEAQKAFPSKVWMTAEKLRLRFFLLRKQKAEKAKGASESTPQSQAPPTPGEAEQKQQHTLESCPRTPSSCPGQEEAGSSQTIPEPPKNAE
ncbi:hypothetical protein AB1Y20_004416 [Prymnesium parvum]|uniref:Hpc2-related domain-containing protein n=1 Tax=Prymnesium parvum TaxID=97485 RepID=A0AB34IWT3_PRYPA